MGRCGNGLSCSLCVEIDDKVARKCCLIQATFLADALKFLQLEKRGRSYRSRVVEAVLSGPRRAACYITLA